jgi:hypothetical protein
MTRFIAIAMNLCVRKNLVKKPFRRAASGGNAMTKLL